jgi:hypothetical protein
MEIHHKLNRTGKPILSKGPKQGYICNLKKSDGDKNRTILALTATISHHYFIKVYFR